MAEKRGIEETKDIIDFVFSFVEAVGKAKADGEMSWSDARYFIDPVKKLFEAVDDIEEVLPEIEDLTDEQRRETEKIIRKMIGGPEEFLMTSLASQGEMNTFIKEKTSARKNVLSKFLNLTETRINISKYLGVKTSKEIKNIENCHIEDGLSVVQFIQ